MRKTVMKVFTKIYIALLGLFVSFQASATSGGLQLSGQDDGLFGPFMKFLQNVVDNMTGGVAIGIFAIGVVTAYLAWTFDPKSKALGMAIRAIFGLIAVFALGMFVAYFRTLIG
jgi:type IV secretory pathway VirB2 component (pilin)